jgi:hypothetical protein
MMLRWRVPGVGSAHDRAVTRPPSPSPPPRWLLAHRKERYQQAGDQPDDQSLQKTQEGVPYVPVRWHTLSTRKDRKARVEPDQDQIIENEQVEQVEYQPHCVGIGSSRRK